MGITHASGVRDALADTVVDLVDAGSGNAAGQFAIVDSGVPADLIVFTLQNPAFGAASSGTAAAAGLPIDTSAIASGTADTCELRDRDLAVILSGTVTGPGGGGDAEITSTSVQSDQAASLTVLSYSASP